MKQVIYEMTKTNISIFHTPPSVPCLHMIYFPFTILPYFYSNNMILPHLAEIFDESTKKINFENTKIQNQCDLNVHLR